jgi:transposase
MKRFDGKARPDVDMRDLKALEISARLRIVWDKDAWVVPSQTTAGATYRVTFGERPSCQCDDWQLRQPQLCKHIIAARLTCERDHGGKAPSMDTTEVPKKKTYKQNWPLYNFAQGTERHRFQILLHELCRGIQEPPRAKTGRIPRPTRDAIFAIVYKVYSTFSSRRFQCDLDDAHAKGYLLGPVPGMKVPSLMENADYAAILQELIRQSSLPLRTVETTFAPDSTGFSTSRFVRWFDEKYGVEKSGREWVKAHAICGVKTNIVTDVRILDKNAADSPQFKPMVEETAKNFTVKEVPADKAYLSHDNLELVESLGGTAFVPFKSNSVSGVEGSLWEKMFHYFQFRREDFLKHYHARSLIESTFAMCKAKFRDSVRSKTDTAMKNEVLCKFLCHNLCVVHQSHIELGIEPIFWADKPPAEAPVTLPFARPC